jgi:transposase
MELSRPAYRRRHGADLKARVVAECAQPGASVAAVALAHGLNANLVHRWRRQAGVPLTAPTEPQRQLPTQFVPLTVEPTQVSCEADIRIEVRRGATVVAVSWPQAAAAQCGAWLRELLR